MVNAMDDAPVLKGGFFMPEVDEDESAETYARGAKDRKIVQLWVDTKTGLPAPFYTDIDGVSSDSPPRTSGSSPPSFDDIQKLLSFEQKMGVAVVGADFRNGFWSWTCASNVRDDGSEYTILSLLVSDSSATLLHAGCRIKFTPAPNYNTNFDELGQPRAVDDRPFIYFRAWSPIAVKGIAVGLAAGDTGVNILIDFEAPGTPESPFGRDIVNSSVSVIDDADTDGPRIINAAVEQRYSKVNKSYEVVYMEGSNPVPIVNLTISPSIFYADLDELTTLEIVVSGATNGASEMLLVDLRAMRMLNLNVSFDMPDSTSLRYEFVSSKGSGTPAKLTAFAEALRSLRYANQNSLLTGGIRNILIRAAAVSRPLQTNDIALTVIAVIADFSQPKVDLSGTTFTDIDMLVRYTPGAAAAILPAATVESFDSQIMSLEIYIDEPQPFESIEISTVLEFPGLNITTGRRSYIQVEGLTSPAACTQILRSLTYVVAAPDVAELQLRKLIVTVSTSQRTSRPATLFLYPDGVPVLPWLDLNGALCGVNISESQGIVMDSLAGGGLYSGTVFEEDGDPIRIIPIDVPIEVMSLDESILGAVITIQGAIDQPYEFVECKDFDGGSALVFTYDVGEPSLTITGSATAAEYAAVIKSCTYRNEADEPNTKLGRTINFRLRSTGGGDLGPSSSVKVAIKALNDAPKVSHGAPPLAFTVQQGVPPWNNQGLSIAELIGSSIDNYNNPVLKDSPGPYKGFHVLHCYDSQGRVGCTWTEANHTCNAINAKLCSRDEIQSVWSPALASTAAGVSWTSDTIIKDPFSGQAQRSISKQASDSIFFNFGNDSDSAYLLHATAGSDLPYFLVGRRKEKLKGAPFAAACCRVPIVREATVDIVRNGLRGTVSFSQAGPEFPTVVSLSFRSTFYNNTTKFGSFGFGLFTYPVPHSSGNLAESCFHVGPYFDPTNGSCPVIEASLCIRGVRLETGVCCLAGAVHIGAPSICKMMISTTCSSPEDINCMLPSGPACVAGAMSLRYGLMNGTDYKMSTGADYQRTVIDPSLTMYGSKSIIGRSFVIFNYDGVAFECGTVRKLGETIEYTASMGVNSGAHAHIAVTWPIAGDLTTNLLLSLQVNAPHGSSNVHYTIASTNSPSCPTISDSQVLIDFDSVFGLIVASDSEPFSQKVELPSSAVSNIAELPGSNLILRGPNGHVVREGCGIVAESRKVHAEINMLGTFGRVTFEQAGPDANVVINIRITGYNTSFVGADYSIYPAPLDPYLSLDNKSSDGICSSVKGDMFETDLPFKGSKWSNAYPLKDAGGGEAWVTFQDNTISLYSSGDSDKADVAGRSIRIKAKEGVVVCATIGFPGPMVVAKAKFRAPLVQGAKTAIFGTITFTQDKKHRTDRTVIVVSLDWIDGRPADVQKKYTWSIQKGTSPLTCSNIGSVLTVHEAHGLRKIGALTDRHGGIRIGCGTSVFSDNEISITGEASILGYRVVVFDEVNPMTPIGCAAIAEVHNRVVHSSFNANGIVGSVTMKQADLKSSTTISVVLEGIGEAGALWQITETEATAVRSESGDLVWDCSNGLSPRQNIFNPSSYSSGPVLTASNGCTNKGDFTGNPCKLGDLTGYFGRLKGSSASIQALYSHPALPLSGSRSLIGRAILISSADGSRSACAPLTVNESTVVLEAIFNVPDSSSVYGGALRGMVRLSQPEESPETDTTVVVSLEFECARAGYSWPTKLRRYTERISGSPHVVYTVANEDPYGNPTEEIFNNRLISDNLLEGFLGSYGPTKGTSPLISANSCSDLCTRDKRCKAWSWASSLAPGNITLGFLTGDCFLFANAPHDMVEVAVVGFISGGRGCLTPMPNNTFNWYVSDERPSEVEPCSATETTLYNPSHIPLNCTNKTLPCAVGDLSGKHGALVVPSVGNGAVFIDEQLPLQGPGSLINRPIVIVLEDTIRGKASFCARLTRKYSVAVTDKDSNADVRGIAITGLDSEHGAWQVKCMPNKVKVQHGFEALNDWQPLDAKLINPTNALRLLTSSENRLRFLPNDTFVGTQTCKQCPIRQTTHVCKSCNLNRTAGNLKFVGWDQTDEATDCSFGDVRYDKTAYPAGRHGAYSKEAKQVTVEVIPRSINISAPSGTRFTTSYSAEDHAGNIGHAANAREILIKDTVKPVIWFRGTEAVEVNAGEKYVDFGAMAFDSRDGDVTASLAVEKIVATYTSPTRLNPMLIPRRIGNACIAEDPVDSLGPTSTTTLNTLSRSGTKIEITLTATDAAGNVGKLNRTLTITDTIPPVLNLPTGLVALMKEPYAKRSDLKQAFLENASFFSGKACPAARATYLSRDLPALTCISAEDNVDGDVTCTTGGSPMYVQELPPVDDENEQWYPSQTNAYSKFGPAYRVNDSCIARPYFCGNKLHQYDCPTNPDGSSAVKTISIADISAAAPLGTRYLITYGAMDSSGNLGYSNLTLVVVDHTSPRLLFSDGTSISSPLSSFQQWTKFKVDSISSMSTSCLDVSDKECLVKTIGWCPEGLYHCLDDTCQSEHCSEEGSPLSNIILYGSNVAAYLESAPWLTLSVEFQEETSTIIYGEIRWLGCSFTETSHLLFNASERSSTIVQSIDVPPMSSRTSIAFFEIHLNTSDGYSGDIMLKFEFMSVDYKGYHTWENVSNSGSVTFSHNAVPRDVRGRLFLFTGPATLAKNGLRLGVLICSLRSAPTFYRGQVFDCVNGTIERDNITAYRVICEWGSSHLNSMKINHDGVVNPAEFDPCAGCIDCKFCPQGMYRCPDDTCHNDPRMCVISSTRINPTIVTSTSAAGWKGRGPEGNEFASLITSKPPVNSNQQIIGCAGPTSSEATITSCVIICSGYPGCTNLSVLRSAKVAYRTSCDLNAAEAVLHTSSADSTKNLKRYKRYDPCEKCSDCIFCPPGLYRCPDNRCEANPHHCSTPSVTFTTTITALNSDASSSTTFVKNVPPSTVTSLLNTSAYQNTRGPATIVVGAEGAIGGITAGMLLCVIVLVWFLARRRRNNDAAVVLEVSPTSTFLNHSVFDAHIADSAVSTDVSSIPLSKLDDDYLDVNGTNSLPPRLETMSKKLKAEAMDARCPTCRAKIAVCVCAVDRGRRKAPNYAQCEHQSGNKRCLKSKEIGRNFCRSHSCAVQGCRNVVSANSLHCMQCCSTNEVLKIRTMTGETNIYNVDHDHRSGAIHQSVVDSDDTYETAAGVGVAYETVVDDYSSHDSITRLVPAVLTSVTEGLGVRSNSIAGDGTSIGKSKIILETIYSDDTRQNQTAVGNDNAYETVVDDSNVYNSIAPSVPAVLKSAKKDLDTSSNPIAGGEGSIGKSKMILVDGHAVLVPEAIYLDNKMQNLGKEIEGELNYSGFMTATEAPESIYAAQFEIYGRPVSEEVYTDYRATQLKLSASMVGDDSEKYGAVWAKTIVSDFKSIVLLKSTCDSVMLPLEEPRQPMIDGTQPNTGEYWSRLKAEYSIRGRVEQTTTALQAVATAARGKLIIGPFKKDKRVIEKAKLSYNMDYSFVKDYFRFSIECNTITNVLAGLQYLISTDCELISLRIKNRFDPMFDAAVHSANYRDLQIISRIPGTSGLCVEVQLHLQSMYAIKSDVVNDIDSNGKTGHARYIEHRERKERLKFRLLQKIGLNASGTMIRNAVLNVNQMRDEDL